MMLQHKRAILVIAAVSVIAVGVAACGGSNDNSDSSNAAATVSAPATGADTVTVKSISGTGDVLVDSSGAALYTNNMDSGSKIACTGQCVTAWVPLAAPPQGNPSSSEAAVQAKLGTTKRPDGATQVTFDGKPLYTFVEDSPGQVNGGGFSDAFGGTHFTWTAATTGGSSSGSSGATTTTQSSGGSGGGSMGY